jgi:hypothetical protein
MISEAQISPGIPPAIKSRLLAVAGKVFWWGEPSGWLENEPRFLAQVMTYGDWDDVRTVMHAIGKDAFRRALAQAPSGVFDIKSWTFWHAYFRLPVPPLPQRNL